MAKVLAVTCKTCKKPFASGIQMDEGSFKSAQLVGNSYNCPDGHVNKYDKEDHFFAEAR
jgi:hypothetical protein